MNKEYKEAEEVVNLLNKVGKQLGYKDVTITGHLLADIERFLTRIPKGDSKSDMMQQLSRILLVLKAVRVISNEYLVAFNGRTFR